MNQKSLTKRFDQLADRSKHMVASGNIVLSYGALIMMASLTIYITSKESYGLLLGVAGVVVGYVGVSMTILAENHASRTNRIIRIVSLPILLCILGWLELHR